MTAVNDRVESAANIVALPSKRPAWQHRYARRLLATDVVSVVLAVGLAQWLRFGGLDAGSLGDFDYTAVSIVLFALWMCALSINHSRSPRVVGSGVEEYRRVWLATLTVFGGVAILSMLFKLEIARGYLMIALPGRVGAVESVSMAGQAGCSAYAPAGTLHHSSARCR